MRQVAFVGLGNMGGPMAANLVKAGYDVTGFDLSQTVVDALVAAGGKAAPTVSAAVDGAEVVVTMLPAGPHVRSVYLGDGAQGDGGQAGLIAAAAPGALLIDCSTIDVNSARAVAAAADSAGLPMIDAPVSGGTVGAENGTLTFMVGGPDAAVAAARPILEVMGKTIVHCGGPGTGQAAKICNNMILGISMIGVCEAFALADRLGLDRQRLFDVSSKSSGQCWSLTTYCPVPGPVPTSPANRGYTPGFSAAMMAKDLRLAQQAAQSSGATTTMGGTAAGLYSLYCNVGHGNRDFSGIIEMIVGDDVDG